MASSHHWSAALDLELARLFSFILSVSQKLLPQDPTQETATRTSIQESRCRRGPEAAQEELLEGSAAQQQGTHKPAWRP